MDFKNTVDTSNQTQVFKDNYTGISDTFDDITKFARNTTSGNDPRTNYDSVGAMHFIVAVILIYGFAVMGVFIMSFLQRSRSSHKDIDMQANYFFKDINNARNRLTRSERLQTINKFMEEIGVPPKSENRTKALGTGILSYVALPIIINGTDRVKQNGCIEATKVPIASPHDDINLESNNRTELSEYV